MKALLCAVVLALLPTSLFAEPSTRPSRSKRRSARRSRREPPWQI